MMIYVGAGEGEGEAMVSKGEMTTDTTNRAGRFSTLGGASAMTYKQYAHKDFGMQMLNSL